ncbi:MAG: hypothetical protein LBI42_07465 [Chitinispirillales bacterium]|nr:hypothetical protein [Chitinispirillales bacterium]
MITLVKSSSHSCLRKAFCCLIAFALCFTIFADNKSSFKKIINRFEALPEYYLEQDMRWYSNYKNEEFKESFLVSGNTEFEAMFVSYEKRFFLGAIYSNYIGMGRQNASILFSPRDVNYTLKPFFEFRHNRISYQTGLDHRCFHQVDRKERETPYWNVPYLRIASGNYRYQLQRKQLLESNRWDFFDRIAWLFEIGYFVREFGNMDKSLLNGFHPWGSSAKFDARYYFLKSKSWLIGARHKTSLYCDTAGVPYWSGELELSADVYSRKHALGFFINYNYEFPRLMPMYDPTEYSKSTGLSGPKRLMPLFSKDRLVEFGVRWRL